MSLPSDVRPLLAQGVITAALCVGGYLALVAPAHDDIRRVRDEIASLEAEAAANQRISAALPGLLARRETIREQVRDLARRARPVRDHAELFSRLTLLAAEYNVTIERHEPGRPAPIVQKVDPAAPAPPPNAPPPPQDVSLDYALTVAGSFADIADFAAALQRDFALTRIESVRLSPLLGRGPGLVAAQIRTRHYALDLGAAGAIAAGGAP